MPIGTPLVGTVAAGADQANSPLTPALPAGTLTGSTLLLVAFCRQGGTTTISNPLGWTQRENSVAGGHSLISTRVYQAGDVAPSVVFGNVSNNQSIMAQVIAFPGVDTATTIDVLGTRSSWSNQQNMGPISGITTGVANAGVVVIAFKQDDFTSVATLTGDSLTWSEVSEQATTLGSDMGFVVGFATRPTVGAIAAKTFTVTGGKTADGGGIILSLRPAVAPHIVTAVPASATASRPVPQAKLKATAVRASATASGLVPIARLKVTAPRGSATASRPVPTPSIKVGPAAARATASAPVPAVHSAANVVIRPPVGAATASFPVPFHASEVREHPPPASAAASLPVPASKTTVGVPRASASASVPTPNPKLAGTPQAASALADGAIPLPSVRVVGAVGDALAQGVLPTPEFSVGAEVAIATAAFPAPHFPVKPSLQANLPTRLRYARNTTTLALHGPTTLVIDPLATNLVTFDEEMELVLDG